MEFKIGSFNLEKFAYRSNKDLEKIAEIIQGEEMDIVALQEIFGDKNSKVCGAKALMDYLCGWDYCFDIPKDSIDPNKTRNIERGEGYSYIWNTSRFKLSEYRRLGQKKKFEPRIINSLSGDVNVDCSLFARTPYYIRLQPLNGGFFELRLINVHIYFGSNTLSDIAKRKAEYNILVNNIYPDISQTAYGTFRVPYTIAMGDYNLNLFQLNEFSAFSYSVGTQTIQQELTTLRNKSFGYANDYDHFSYDPKTSPIRVISCGRVNAIDKYCMSNMEYYRKNISNHLPIQLTIDI